MTSITKSGTEETRAQGVRAVMCDCIHEEFDKLIIEQINPWVFFNAKGVQVKRFGIGEINISGVEFSGSAKLVFWENYIQPFIQDIIKRMIQKTVEFAEEKEIPLSFVIGSTKDNLTGGIDRIFKKMAEIDRRLRGKGNPQNVSKYDPVLEIKEMNSYLVKQIETYKNLEFISQKSWFRNWYDRKPHQVWIISIIITILLGILSLIISLL